jgi:hypothetical protein
MKPEHDDGLVGQDVFSPRERLQPPEIVGQVNNPVLEAIRRLWWCAFDRACEFFMLLRLLIHDRIYGPEPPTAADLKREADNERLVRAFPGNNRGDRAAEMPGRGNRDAEIGSHYR